MPFDITVTVRPSQGGVQPTVVRFIGSLEFSSAAAAETVLAPLVATTPKVVVLDLAELRFLDSTGISVILKTRRAIEAQGGSVFVTNMQPQIRKVFDIVKALPSTSIFKNMQEMDEYLKGIQENFGNEE